MAKEIVSYFLRNPSAADTLEGIARWRLLDERIHQSVRMTEAALRSLVKAGLLLAERTKSAGIIYHLNRNKRNEAENFLKSLEFRSTARPTMQKRGRRK